MSQSRVSELPKRIARNTSYFVSTAHDLAGRERVIKWRRGVSIPDFLSAVVGSMLLASGRREPIRLALLAAFSEQLDRH